MIHLTSRGYEDAPCIGLWSLFDSTEPDDHETAASLCATCPHLARCGDEMAQMTDYRHRTPGTRAGKLTMKNGTVK